MKRQIQKTGVRKYFGDDLVALQSEPLRAIDALCGSSGQCIIDGCDISPAAGGRYNVSRGMVALMAKDEGGEDRVMAMPFAGAEDVVLPIYLTVRSTAEERVYGDGRVKPIAYDYRAVAAGVKPADGVPFIAITAEGGNRFVDAMQDALHRFATDAEKASWDSKAPGNHNHDERYTNYTHPDTPTVRHVSDAEKAAWSSKAPGNHNHDERYTNYTHPNTPTVRHVSDAEKATWNGKAAGNLVTTSANGLMSAADKAKLNRLQSFDLATFRCDKGGGIIFKCGPFADLFRINKISVGKFKILRMDSGYGVNPIVIGCANESRGDSMWAASFVVQNQSSDGTFEIWLCSHNNFVDCGFSFTVKGDLI